MEIEFQKLEQQIFLPDFKKHPKLVRNISKCNILFEYFISFFSVNKNHFQFLTKRRNSKKKLELEIEFQKLEKQNSLPDVEKHPRKVWNIS
jgi:hypothetical protein